MTDDNRQNDGSSPQRVMMVRMLLGSTLQYFEQYHGTCFIITGELMMLNICTSSDVDLFGCARFRWAPEEGGYAQFALNKVYCKIAEFVAHGIDFVALGIEFVAHGIEFFIYQKSNSMYHKFNSMYRKICGTWVHVPQMVACHQNHIPQICLLKGFVTLHYINLWYMKHFDSTLPSHIP
jgi:hypothetical protein